MTEKKYTGPNAMELSAIYTNMNRMLEGATIEKDGDTHVKLLAQVDPTIRLVLELLPGIVNGWVSEYEVMKNALRFTQNVTAETISKFTVAEFIFGKILANPEALKEAGDMFDKNALARLLAVPDIYRQFESMVEEYGELFFFAASICMMFGAAMNLKGFDIENLSTDDDALLKLLGLD